MNTGLIDHIETGTERMASALFGGAVGFAVYGWLGAVVPQPQLWAWMGASGLGAYLLSAQALKAKARHARDFTLSIFDVRDIEDFMSDDELLLTNADQLDPSELVLTDADQFEAPVMLLTAEDQLDPSELLLTETDQIDPTTEGELVLTDADRLEVKSPSPQPLVLDDILAELGPGSRVVRLFDPKAMPTPGQLKSRIDSHLDQAPSPSAPSDASEALSAALAELRRSLR